MDHRIVDLTGFLIGMCGLIICAVAQRTMGSSWRVGIDETRVTELVITGIFQYSRNPTYLGLYLLLIGIWLIWPTWAMGLLAVIFYILLEIQVRCEESHLLKIHGKDYSDDCARTRRYLGKRGEGEPNG
jgi:protein-S-isoprenylcysteine O-methyltransferase Ste14